MKKKFLLTLAVIALFVCLFAITVSAVEIPGWTEVTEVDITPKAGFDTTSRVLLSNGDGTYSTYLSNYIIKGTDTVFDVSDELDFSALRKATGKNYGYESVIRLEVPVGFTESEARAFRADKGFTSILTIKIPEGFTKLGSYPFYNNASIIEVELPESLEVIEDREAFINATSLVKVNIPSKITTLPNKCFIGCTSLTTVTGCAGLATLGEQVFQNCPLTNTDTSIFSSLESIGYAAFYGSGISSISLPKATSIGSKGFAKCTNLATVLVGPADIGDNAFDEKCPITSLTLVGTKSIGKYAFRYLQEETLVIPDTCLSVATYAFSYAYYKEVVISEKTVFASDAFASQKESGVVLTYVGSEAITPSSVGLSNTKTTVVVATYCNAYNNGTHTVSEELTMQLSNYFEDITFAYVCEKCGEATVDESKTIEALFEDYGYSCTEEAINGMHSMSQFYGVNKANLEKYTEYTGKSFTYGLVASGAKDPLSYENGELNNTENSFVKFSNSFAHDYFGIKINGIVEDKEDAQKDKTKVAVVFCAFVVDNGNVFYLDNGETNETVSGKSYADVFASITSEN